MALDYDADDARRRGWRALRAKRLETRSVPVRLQWGTALNLCVCVINIDFRSSE